MSFELKQRIAFALLMGVVTTGMMSFVLVAFNVGFRENFLVLWLRSWGLGYVLVIPAILLIGPKVQALVGRLIKAR